MICVCVRVCGHHLEKKKERKLGSDTQKNMLREKSDNRVNLRLQSDGSLMEMYSMGRLYSVDFCCIFSFYMVIVSLSFISLLYIYSTLCGGHVW